MLHENINICLNRDFKKVLVYKYPYVVDSQYKCTQSIMYRRTHTQILFLIFLYFLFLNFEFVFLNLDFVTKKYLFRFIKVIFLGNCQPLIRYFRYKVDILNYKSRNFK